MQKAWIAISVVLVMLVGGLGGVLWVMRQNKPSPYWLELPVKDGITKEQFDGMLESYRVVMTQKELLQPIVVELKLAQRWKLGDDAAAVEELRKRVFVRRADIAGKLMIGVQGKRKEQAVTKEIVNHIGQVLSKEIQRQRGTKPAAPPVGNPS